VHGEKCGRDDDQGDHTGERRNDGARDRRAKEASEQRHRLSNLIPGLAPVGACAHTLMVSERSPRSARHHDTRRFPHLGVPAAARVAALLVTIGAVACVPTHAGDAAARLAPDTTTGRPQPSVSLVAARIRAHRALPSRATFWRAVESLDLDAADSSALAVSERLFTRALRALVNGDMGAAEVLFGSLMDAHDRLIRGRARIGLTLALEAQGKWPALAALPPLDALPGDTTFYVDRAAVDAWAGVLRTAPPARFSVPAFPQQLPLERSAIGTPVVRVLVNGQPWNFWIDTGAGMSLIASNVAAASGVRPLGADTLAIAAAAGRVAARPALLHELDLGHVRVRNLPVALLDPGVLRIDRRMANEENVSVPIAGVIGSDVLRHLNLVLDMGAGTLTVARPPRRVPRRASPRTLVWVGYPAVRMLTRDGRPVLFGLDTGADSTVVTDAWLRHTPDPQLVPVRARLDALGQAASTGLRVARYVAVGVGAYALRMRDVPVVPERGQTFVRFDGVLGANILTGAALHVDMTNGVFELRRPLPAAERDTGLVRVVP